MDSPEETRALARSRSQISRRLGFEPSRSSADNGWRKIAAHTWRGFAEDFRCESLDQPMIVLHTGGETEIPVVVAGRELATTRPGVLTVIPPATPVTWRINGRVHSISVHLAAACFEGLLDSDPHGQELAIRFRSGRADAALPGFISALEQELVSPTQLGPLLADSVADCIALQLVGRHLQSDALARGGLPGRVLSRVLERIEASLEDGVSLDDLALEAGLSRAHFARAFKQSTGRSPHQFLTTRRLSFAADLLTESAEPLASIAHRSGFCSQAHFSSAFKREMKVTPREYRNVRLRNRRLGTRSPA